MVVGRGYPEMTKSIYSVAIVARDKLSLWHELWDSRSPSKAAVIADQDGSLSKCATIEASSLSDAIRIAEAENPGHVAIPSACNKIG